LSTTHAQAFSPNTGSGIATRLTCLTCGVIEHHIDDEKRKIEISRLHCRALEELLQAPQIISRFSCQQDPVSQGDLTGLFRFKDAMRT
jgi:hypothetical protein